MRLLALALLLTACGTTRLYEGPELPPGQTARIEESHSMWDGQKSDLLELDGRDVDQGFWDSGFAVLPGPHVIVGQASRPRWNYSDVDLGDRCTLSFTAEAGVTYELCTDESELHPPFNLYLVDTRSDTTVADNEPDRYEDCLTAEVDWGGRTWVPDEFSTNARRSQVVLVPEGTTIQDTDEWVELQCITGVDAAPDVDMLKDQMWDEWEDVADDPSIVVLAREEGAEPSLLFLFSGAADDQRHVGLVKLRTSGMRLHVLMWFRAAADVPQSDLDLWTARFEQARLFEPAAR
jgi:hypothetical protein